ncbi:hypothetical protein MRX96_001653 [Rhipicephalus microplus]
MVTPLPTAPHVGAWTVIANTGAVPRATDDSAPRLASAHLPRYSCARDLQSPEEFLERLENFCLVTGVNANKRLTHVVPAVLEGGAKLWWRFVRGFDSWEQFTAAFRSEFSSIDAKPRLKAELEQCTQHPEENLKEFIYAIATFYECIKEEVSEAEKVQRVLRQMHPHLQDLAEGHAYNDLAELVKAADGLMERAWRCLQYRPPPLPSNQVARDLAFRPSQAPDHRSLPQPNTMATASFASMLLPHRHRPLITGHCIQLRYTRLTAGTGSTRATQRLRSHPLGRDQCRGRSPRVEQCVCSAIAVVDSATYLVTVPQVDEWGHPFSSGASDRVTCKHSARETSGGRCCPGGHLRQCAPSSEHSRWQRAPYGRPYRVVDVQGPARYRLKCKLLRTATPRRRPKLLEPNPRETCACCVWHQAGRSQSCL